jgi:hypothetical protein
MNMRVSSVLLLIAAVAMSASAALVEQRLYNDVYNGTRLSSAVRPLSACSATDYECLCLRAVEENNRIRQRHGKDAKPVAGPKSMLQNAVDHCKELPGSFSHQDLSVAKHKVQCGVFISGENIAMNYGSDPVAACMKQWEVGCLAQLFRSPLRVAFVIFVTCTDCSISLLSHLPGFPGPSREHSQ